MWEQVQTHNTLVTNSTRMNSEFEGTTQGRGRAGSQYDYIAVAADDDQKKILLKVNGQFDARYWPYLSHPDELTNTYMLIFRLTMECMIRTKLVVSTTMGLGKKS